MLTVNNVFIAAAVLAVTMLVIYYWRELRRLRRWFRKRVLKIDKKRPGYNPPRSSGSKTISPPPGQPGDGETEA